MHSQTTTLKFLLELSEKNVNAWPEWMKGYGTVKTEAEIKVKNDPIEQNQSSTSNSITDKKKSL